MGLFCRCTSLFGEFMHTDMGASRASYSDVTMMHAIAGTRYT